ncbi:MULTISPECIES: molybdate ABC transporter substrate-binding protein [unclassified Schlesneria]|uniref:molybdate ABC transporter substrate-binding protein n=1 Tax=unclassified Schlesneria TaxID=2762017 RepID=UPI002F1B662E
MRLQQFRAPVIGAFLLLVLTGCDQFTDPRPVQNSAIVEPKVTISVAAASDLKYVLEEIITEFRQAHPEIAVKPTYGSSGSFYSQLLNKAPFDVFLSADVAYPQQLIDQGLAISESLIVYAMGRIVLWVRNDCPVDVEREGIASLRSASIKKIAIANPQHAPYGKAAEAALYHFDIYEEVEDRIVFGENIAQAAQFVESGAADIGIIAVSLTIADALREKGRQWPFPKDSYPPLEQGGVIMSTTQERGACEAFLKFLGSDVCRDILKRYAFSYPGEMTLDGPVAP